MKIGSMLAGVTLAVAAAMPASAHIEQYKATLTGPNEFPTNSSPATGTALVTFDLDLATMRVEVTFAGLIGTTTASHIHCCTSSALDLTKTAGVATITPSFTDFPLGVKAGSYDHTYNLGLASTYNATFITGNGGTVGSAMNALIAGVDAGKAYLNIHTGPIGVGFPGGEIRGFLVPVPEPETYAMMLAGLGLVGFAAARRRKVTA